MYWNAKRRIIYGVATIIIVFLVLTYAFRDRIFPVPSCVDGKQNGYESGIDCGGTCSLRCSAEVIPLSVTWTRVIKTASDTYDLVGMVSNKNIDNAPRTISYTFSVIDKEGGVLGNFTGITVAPLDGEFPIIKTNIKISGTPENVILTLTDGPHYTVAEKPTSPTVRISNIRYEAGSIPRVTATVFNTKRATVSNLPLRVVLFDSNDNAYGVGQTIIPFLDKEGVQDISFTWDAPFKEAPIKIRIYPIFDPFLVIQ